MKFSSFQLAQPIRLMLEYLGVEYEDKRYPVGPAPDYDKTEWWHDKENLGLDFPNVRCSWKWNLLPLSIIVNFYRLGSKMPYFIKPNLR